MKEIEWGMLKTYMAYLSLIGLQSKFIFSHTAVLLLSEQGSPSIMIPACISSRTTARKMEERDIKAPREMAFVAFIWSILWLVSNNQAQWRRGFWALSASHL